ncbi:ras-related protein Rab-26 isoform 2-T2 [Alca torda]
MSGALCHAPSSPRTEEPGGAASIFIALVIFFPINCPWKQKAEAASRGCAVPFGLVGVSVLGGFLSPHGGKSRLTPLLPSAFQIWDTAGQERFRSVTHAYYRDAHALLLLYDVTNKASFDNIQAWLTEIHEYAQQDVVLMLLGNKVDSAQDRVVKREDGEKLAKYGVPFMETSAKSGLNVELAFTAIAKELKHRSMKLPNEPKFKLHDYVKKEVRGSGCCRS